METMHERTNGRVVIEHEILCKFHAHISLRERSSLFMEDQYKVEGHIKRYGR